MDPTFTSDRPGKSPMGMDLVPVYASSDTSPPPGTVQIDPGFVQRIGVRTETVERGSIAQTIRTVGTLAHNDRQIAWVNTKYDGWIENVAVNYLGETVEEDRSCSTSTARSLSPPRWSTCRRSTTPRGSKRPSTRDRRAGALPDRIDARQAPLLGHHRRPDCGARTGAHAAADPVGRVSGDRCRGREAGPGARRHARRGRHESLQDGRPDDHLGRRRGLRAPGRSDARRAAGARRAPLPARTALHGVRPLPVSPLR